jgi:small GTP-binding protein
VLDFEPEEHRRRISINLGLAHLEHEGFKVNLLDTPGFLDFAGQVRSALAAAEGALLVVSPSQQLAVGTEVAWQQLSQSQKPRLVVVNKMDKENADFFGALDTMRAQLNPRPVALQVPIGAEAGFRGVVDLMRMKAFVATPDGRGSEGPIPDDLKSLAEERREQLVEAAAEGDDSLLEKYLDEGALTDEEFEEVKQHTAIGALMVERAARFGRVHHLVRWSHERWDGGGYPDGLAGVGIPLGARIICVCDAYDAMVSDRPYRAAMSRGEALAELRVGAGTQFDPAVVDALVLELEGGALDDVRIA